MPLVMKNGVAVFQRPPAEKDLESKSLIWYLYANPHTIPTFFTDPDSKQRHVGVELEVCGLLTKDSGGPAVIQGVANKWKGAVAHDGSLPPARGFEMKTSPANGKFFVEQLREFCDVLAKYNAWVDERAGTHIHVDARDLSFGDLGRLMLLYRKIEEELCKTQPIKRLKTKYCTPLGDGYTWDMEQATTSQDEVKIASKLVYSDRYRALNFKAIQKFKTVEVRMHEGTLNADEIIVWADVWRTIVDSSKKLTNTRIQAFPGGIETLGYILKAEQMDYLLKRQAKYAKGWTKKDLENFKTKDRSPWDTPGPKPFWPPAKPVQTPSITDTAAYLSAIQNQIYSANSSTAFHATYSDDDDD